MRRMEKKRREKKEIMGWALRDAHAASDISRTSKRGSHSGGRVGRWRGDGRVNAGGKKNVVSATPMMARRSRFVKFVETILIPHIIVPIIHSLKDLDTQFIQYNVRLQNMTFEEELYSTQPIFNPEEDVSVDTLKYFEVNEVTQVEDYWRETSEECEVFQIEPEIVIALNKGENEMKIDVISNKPKKPQIESEEDQPLVLVQPPTLPYTFGTPCKGVELMECSQILYTADTFVLGNPDVTDSFVLEVPNELLNMKEGVHASLPKHIDSPFVVDISKGKGIT
ncbi:hypothetical protein Syun_003943 [Stephania yunnanensis]|uniref:Uncharacterized protein n=1 Tax=Stephania yunnanensis TaxID=152371 RepID=A0AAP0L261_9MAGN